MSASNYLPRYFKREGFWLKRGSRKGGCTPSKTPLTWFIFALKSLSLPVWWKVKGIIQGPSVAVPKIKFWPAFKWGITGISLLLPMKLLINQYLSQPAIAYPFCQVYQTAFHEMLCAQKRWFDFSSHNQPEVNFDQWGRTGPSGKLKRNLRTPADL